MFILTKPVFNVAWVVFSFIFHIFIHGLSMLTCNLSNFFQVKKDIEFDQHMVDLGTIQNALKVKH